VLFSDIKDVTPELGSFRIAVVEWVEMIVVKAPAEGFLFDKIRKP
jgi:hypothetical protein